MDFGKNARTSREVIEDICGCKGKSGEKGYCILRELIILNGLDDRTLEQSKCIEKFKFDNGISGEDGGWEDASKQWIELGYAKKFSEVYRDGMKGDQIYYKIFPELKKFNGI